MRQFFQGTNNHPPPIIFLNKCSQQAGKQYDIPYASRKWCDGPGPGEVNRIFGATDLGFIDIDRVFDRPISDFLKVPASMTSVEVRVRDRVSLHPVPCDHRHISIAHNILPHHFDAVIWTVTVYHKQWYLKARIIFTKMLMGCFGRMRRMICGLVIIGPSGLAKQVLQKCESRRNILLV
jgi:hypothetical protein